MKVRIQVVIEAENGEPEKVEEIARLERGALRPEELGLTLAEAKVLLHGMQQAVVTEQIVEYLEKFKTCPDCGAHRTRKGRHLLVYRTLFGKFNLVSPRLYDCPCQNHGRHSLVEDRQNHLILTVENDALQGPPGLGPGHENRRGF